MNFQLDFTINKFIINERMKYKQKKLEFHILTSSILQFVSLNFAYFSRNSTTLIKIILQMISMRRIKFYHVFVRI